jgi:hypothetical protein
MYKMSLPISEIVENIFICLENQENCRKYFNSFRNSVKLI